MCSTVDEIYHLAAPASPFHYMHNPIKTIKTNAVGTGNMLGMYYAVVLHICVHNVHVVFSILFTYVCNWHSFVYIVLNFYFSS